jgi:hypothetical protein
MDPIVTKDGSKTVITKSSGKTVVAHLTESYTYNGVLYIWNGAAWVPKPEYTYQDPYTARPTWAYYDGQWNLIQSF